MIILIFGNAASAPLCMRKGLATVSLVPHCFQATRRLSLLAWAFARTVKKDLMGLL